MGNLYRFTREKNGELQTTHTREDTAERLRDTLKPKETARMIGLAARTCEGNKTGICRVREYDIYGEKVVEWLQKVG